MTTALVNLVPTADTTMVAAVPGKIIRLHQIISGASTQLIIKSGSTPLSPPLKTGSAATSDVKFVSPLQTARGEALVGLQETGISDFPVWIAYEIVD